MIATITGLIRSFALTFFFTSLGPPTKDPLQNEILRTSWYGQTSTRRLCLTSIIIGPAAAYPSVGKILGDEPIPFSHIEISPSFISTLRVTHESERAIPRLVDITKKRLSYFGMRGA